MHDLQQRDREAHMALAKTYAKNIAKHNPKRQSIYEDAINKGLAGLRESWARRGSRRIEQEETKLIESIIEDLEEADLQEAISASLKTDDVTENDFIEITLANTGVPVRSAQFEYSKEIRKTLATISQHDKEQRRGFVHWAAENLKLAYDRVIDYEKKGKTYRYRRHPLTYQIADRLNALNRRLTRDYRETFAKTILDKLLEEEHEKEREEKRTSRL